MTNTKSLGIAYLWWLFLGMLGAHCFYIGKIGRGIGYLLTAGWFGLGPMIDLFTLPAQVRTMNAMRELAVLRDREMRDRIRS